VKRIGSDTAVALSLVLLGLSGCGGGDEETPPEPIADAPTETNSDDVADGSDAPDAADGNDAPTTDSDAGPSVTGGTYFYNVPSAPFPSTSHPDVAVHVPKGFRPWDRVGAVVFFHGFNNCVTNVIGSVDTSCTTGSPVRTALHLSDQLDAARVNALLIAIELRYDMATGDPGALANVGQLRKILHETLVDHLDAVLGRPLDVDDLERVVVCTHSGGYQAAAKSISVGSVPQIRQVDLYDSLYGEIATYDGWVRGSITRFDAKRVDELRFSDVYTSGGGTATNSRAMATRMDGWLAPVALSASLLYDDTTATFVTADYLHPLIMKHSALTHDGVPQYYFQRMVSAAGFAPLP